MSLPRCRLRRFLPQRRSGQSLPVPSRRPVLSASAEEWRGWMVERGYPAYRARQVLDWVIRRRAESFEPMSDLPKIVAAAARRRMDGLRHPSRLSWRCT